MAELTVESVKIAIALLPGFLSQKIKDFFLPTRTLNSMDQAFEVIAFGVGNYLLANAAFAVVAWISGRAPV